MRISLPLTRVLHASRSLDLKPHVLAPRSQHPLFTDFLDEEPAKIGSLIPIRGVSSSSPLTTNARYISDTHLETRKLVSYRGVLNWQPVRTTQGNLGSWIVRSHCSINAYPRHQATFPSSLRFLHFLYLRTKRYTNSQLPSILLRRQLWISLPG